MRAQNNTFTNDVRLNNIRQSADGAAADCMGLLQFASTLQLAHKRSDGSDPKTPAPFDPMAAVRAMQAGQDHVEQANSQGFSTHRLQYGGEEGARKWAEEEKKKNKEKKRKRKAKEAKRKAKKEAKLSELMEEKGLSYKDAKGLVDDMYSDSDSSSSSSST